MSHSVRYKPDSIRDAQASINQLQSILLTIYVARIMLHKGSNHLETHGHTHPPTFRSDILVNTVVLDHGTQSAISLKNAWNAFIGLLGVLGTSEPILENIVELRKKNRDRSLH